VSSVTPPAEVPATPRSSGLRWTPRVFADTSRGDPDCHVTIRSFAVEGLDDAAMQARVNAAFAPEAIAKASGHIVFTSEPVDEDAPCATDPAACDASTLGHRILCRTYDGGRSGLFFEAELRPTLLDEHLLSVRDEYGFDGGGVHPSDGVHGVTLDLRTGRFLDARDLLAHPDAEPDWAGFVPADYFASLAQTTGAPDMKDSMSFGIGTIEGSRSLGDGPLPFREFYLTKTGLALVPKVGEVVRILRHQVAEIPFARLAGVLQRDIRR
jgi:hypothetical protein